jgi:hypothetical protein
MPGPQRKSKEPKIKLNNIGTEFSPQQWGKFLARYAETGNITRSSEYAGMTRIAVYKRKKDDPQFAMDLDAAYVIAVDKMEEECQRRAFDGYQRDIYWQGQVVGQETLFSDSMAMFLLKGAKPEKYRDRVSTDNLNTNVDVEADAQEAEEIRESIRAKLFR